MDLDNAQEDPKVDEIALITIVQERPTEEERK